MRSFFLEFLNNKNEEVERTIVLENEALILYVRLAKTYLIAWNNILVNLL